MEEETLEEFYGTLDWDAQQQRKCGKTRAPNGKLRCTVLLTDNGRHFGDHRGYDTLGRMYTWKNTNTADNLGVMRSPWH